MVKHTKGYTMHNISTASRFSKQVAAIARRFDYYDTHEACDLLIAHLQRVKTEAILTQVVAEYKRGIADGSTREDALYFATRYEETETVALARVALGFL